MVKFPAKGAGIINNAIGVLYLMIAGEEMMEAQQVMDGLYE
jgi:hypothetical protein